MKILFTILLSILLISPLVFASETELTPTDMTFDDNVYTFPNTTYTLDTNNPECVLMSNGKHPNPEQMKEFHEEMVYLYGEHK